MVRVITQETYDEVVKENMEEFDMSPEEAIKEATAQFEAQGVNLANIIKDLALGDGDAHVTTTTVNKLKNLKDGDDDELILKELDVLKSECDKDLARRMRAAKEGAYPILIELLEKRYKIYLDNKGDKDATFIINVLNTLTSLMDTQPDLLENKGVDLIMSLLKGDTSDNLLIATFKWTNMCCLRHEGNRQTIFNNNITECFKKHIKSKNKKVLLECLQLMKRLTADDDVRVEFGKAHDHARELGITFIEPLTLMLKTNTTPPLVSPLLSCLSSVTVRHELCALLLRSDPHVLFSVLADNVERQAVLVQACKLVTALAGNDDVKRSLVNSGIVPIIVSLLSIHAGNSNASAVILKSISALSLRESKHGEMFLCSAAPEAILNCMKIHEHCSEVQRNGCWAIRNLVARCRDYNQKFHELGAEEILNKAYDKFSKEFGFDIKSALRDLECDVKLDEQWTGKGVQIEN